MRVLVTGGAGYIGSHTVLTLIEAGYEVSIIDNLSNGKLNTIKMLRKITGAKISFSKIDLLDQDRLNTIFEAFKPNAVIHFAGLKAVQESINNPLTYYNNNVLGTINLINAMSKNQCNKIIFSSTATVYGKPKYLPYDEEHPVSPINPYGQTKLIVEKILRAKTLDLPNFKAVILRYFNPVGAHPNGHLLEDPIGQPNNLMPIIVQVANKTRKKAVIFGTDYDTIDGTAERDYIHVLDLAQAHLRTLEVELQKFETFNIGTGSPISVKNMIKKFEEVHSITIPYETGERRPGDLPIFYANPNKARNILNWKSSRGIDLMCRDSFPKKNKK